MGVQFAGNILVHAQSGPLPIAMGGTGQTTATTAINALLPSQTGNAGKLLTTNGTNISWASGLITPGGTDTQIQFNDAGTFGGNASFTINKTTGALTSTSTLTNTGLTITGAAETERNIKLQTDSSNRWILRANISPEGSGNAGSNFEFLRVADNGATTNQVYTVARNTGVVDFKTTPTINGVAIDTNAGTVTSVDVTGSNGITVLGAPITTTGTISLDLGDITPTSVTATGTVSGSNLSGTNTGDQTITLTGDATGSGTGSFATTLATVNSSVGTYGSSTSVPVVTVNAKGLVTSVTTANISGSISVTGGDLTMSGATGTAITNATLATVNSAPQTDTFRKVTVNGKGLVTNTSAVTSSDITTSLGFTPYNSTNPSGYISGITGGDVTTALGYTPVNKAGDTVSGSLTFSSGTVTGLATPTAGTDATTKNYVDSAVAGLSWKTSVKVATTIDITLSGTQTVDGIALAVGNRVLVKNQSTTSQNGIYVVASGAWTRSTDADTASELDGSAVYVQVGTTQADTGWTETATVTTVGTDPIVYAQFSGSGTYTAGTGLSLTGNTFANTGVTSVSAGTNITVSGSTGSVTIGMATAPTITGTNITGIPNAGLTNSSVTVNGTSIALGASGTVTAAAGTLTGTTLNATVTASSLTSVGTLTSLAVTGTISGSQHISTSSSAALPALSVSTGTGVYNNGTNVLAFSTGSAYAGQFDASGNLMLGTTTLQQSGWAGSGTKFQISSAGVNTTTQQVIKTFSATSNFSGGLSLGKSGSNTLGTLAITGTETLGFLTFDGVNSANGIFAAAAVVGKGIATPGASYGAGALSFQVSDGTTAAAERMLVNSSGATVTGVINATTGLNVSGNGGFTNSANKFGLDNLTGTTRMYSSGANSSTRGTYDFRVTDSVGTLDASAMTLSLAGLAVVGTVTGTSFNSITGLSSTTPAALGTAAVGTGTTAARADHVHAAPTTVSGSAGSVVNTLTINNGGAGSVSGSTYNGSAAITISYNSIGASPLAGSASLTTTGTITSGTWSGSFGAVSGANLTSITGANVTGTVSSATSATTATTANALNTANNYQVNSIGVGTAGSGTAGEIRATNNITAYYSDDRLKTRTGKIENALDKVATLDAFYYHANETAQALGYEAIPEVGISAQQVQAIMPEVVAPAPIDDKYLTVRYERLVPLLIAAIQELQAEVAALKAR